MGMAIIMATALETGIAREYVSEPDTEIKAYIFVTYHGSIP